MKFYYTGASTYNAEQRLASLSLGGFISSSEIQNDLMNNIFSDISELAKQNLRREAVLIAIKNITNETIQDVLLSFNVTDWDTLTSEFSIAFVAASEDECGCFYFDSINDQQALPFVELDVLSSTNYQFSLGDFEVNKIVGIWLIRKIIKARVAPPTCEELAEDFENDVDPVIEEDFSLQLSWDPDSSGSSST